MENYEKLSQLENELFKVRRRIEIIQSGSREFCPTEINQLCTDLQAVTEKMRMVLKSLNNE